MFTFQELANGGSEIFPNYWKAISNMQVLGDLLTEFFRVNRIDEEQMHCIGFSLGAHACGVFYQVYLDKLLIKPGRITGLDPAGPFFSDRSIEEKLSYNDAKFVDVIFFVLLFFSWPGSFIYRHVSDPNHTIDNSYVG